MLYLPVPFIGIHYYEPLQLENKMYFSVLDDDAGLLRATKIFSKFVLRMSVKVCNYINYTIIIVIILIF